MKQETFKQAVIRRTFEASKFPKGSAEREQLNKDPVTSEYMRSYKYVLRVPFVMSNGTRHPTQPFFDRTFRTIAEANARKEKGK